MSQADDKVAPFEITFVAPVPLLRANDLITGFGDVQVSQIQFRLPEVIGGFSASARFDPPVSNADVLAASREKLLQKYSSRGLAIEHEIAQALPASFDSGKAEISSIRILARPSTIIMWWKRNQDVVSLAMPLESQIPWPHHTEDFLK